MSRLIRTRFSSSGSPDKGGDSKRISPTSVMDFEATTKDRGTSSDTLINQLKRQVTNLEHEKASLEHELLNQINTVFFDKETMVGTLQEKLLESEQRLEAERKAHSETKCSFRQKRVVSQGEAKLDILRLQEEIQALKTKNESQQCAIETLKQEKGKDDEALLEQFSLMEKKSHDQFETLKTKHSKQIEKVQLAQAAMADQENNLRQEYEQKLKAAEQRFQSEAEKCKRLEVGLHGAKQAQAVIIGRQAKLEMEAERVKSLEKGIVKLERLHSTRTAEMEQDFQHQLQLVEKKLEAETERAAALEGSLKEVAQARDAFVSELEQDLSQQNQQKVNDLERQLKHKTERTRELELSVTNTEQSQKALQERTIELEASVTDMEQAHKALQDLLCQNDQKLQCAEDKIQVEVAKAQALEDKLQAMEEVHTTKVDELEQQSHDKLCEVELKLQMEEERARALEVSLKEMQESQSAMLGDLEEYSQQELRVMELKLQQETSRVRLLEESLKKRETEEQDRCQQNEAKAAETEQKLQNEQQRAGELEEHLDKTKKEHAAAIDELQQSMTDQNKEKVKYLEQRLQKETERTQTLQDNLRESKNAYTDEILKLETSNNEQLNRLADLIEELRNEQTRTRDLQSSLTATRNFADEHLDRSTGLQKDVAVLTEKLSQTEKERAHLESRTSELRFSLDDTMHEHADRTLHFERECEEREEELTTLRTKLEEAEAAKRQQKEDMDTMQSNLELRRQKDAAFIANIEEQCARRNQEASLLKQQLEQAKSACSVLKDRTGELEAQCTQKTQETDLVSKELSQEKLKNDALRKCIDTTKKENGILVEDMGRLRSQFEETKASNEAMAASVRELRVSLDGAQAAKRELQSSLEAKGEAIFELSVTLDGAQKEKQELRSSLKAKGETIVELEDDIRQLREQVVEEQTTLSTLMNTLGDEENTNSLLQEKQALTAETISHLETMLQLEKDMVEDLKTSVAQEEAEHSDLLAAKTQLQRENERLVDRLDSMAQQLCREEEMVQALQVSLSENENSQAEMMEQVASANAEMEALGDQVEKEQVKNLEFERDRVALLGRIGTLKEELAQSQSTNEDLDNSLKGFRVAKQQSDDKVASQEKDLNLLREKARQFRCQAQKYYHLVNILKASLEGSHRFSKCLEDEHRQIMERLCLQSDQLEIALASNSELKEKLENQSSALEESKAAQEGRSKELKTLQGQHGSLQCQLSSMKDHLKSEQASFASSEYIIAELRGTNDILKAALDSRDVTISNIESTNAALMKKLKARSVHWQVPLEETSSNSDEAQAGTNSEGQEVMVRTQAAAMEDAGNHSIVESVASDQSTPNMHPSNSGESEDQENQDPDKIFDAYYLKTTVESLQEENTELKDLLDDHKKVQETISHLEEDKRSLLSEIDDLQNQLGQKFMSGHQSKPSLEEQQMESIVRATLEERTSQGDAIAELELERGALLSDVEDLRAQLKQAQDSNELLTVSLHRLEHSARRAGTSENARGIDGGEVQPNRENRLKDEQVRDSQTHHDNSTAKPDAEGETPASKEAEEIFVQKETIQALEDQLTKANENVRNLEAQVETLLSSADEKATKDAATIDALNEELESTKEWLEKGLDEVEELRRKLSDSASRLKPSEQKLSDSTKQLKTAEQNNKDLRDQIEQLETDLFDTKQSLKINLEEVERLQDSVAANEEESEESRGLLESFKAAAEHWRREVDKLKVSTEERQNKLKVAYKREVGEYKSRVEEFEQRLLEENEKLRAELLAGKQSSCSCKGEGKLLKEIQGQAEDEKEALQESHKKELTALKQQLDKKDKQKETQDYQLSDANKKISDLQAERKALQSRLEDFEADRMERLLLEMEEKKECNILKTELASERDAVDKCKGDIKKLRSAIEALKKQNSNGAMLTNEVKECKEEIQRLQAAFSALQKKCESAEAQIKREQEKAGKAEEAHKAQMLSSQQCMRASNERLKQKAENHKKEIQRFEATKAEFETLLKHKLLARDEQKAKLEVAYKQKLQVLAEQKASLEAQLEEKRKNLHALLDDKENAETKEDLQNEIKELTEKTIVQGRIIQTQQKKIEVLKQGKEKFYEAKRREIMRDHSEHQNLKKENTALKENVRQVTRERRKLQEQLESFANTLGTSLDSYLQGDSRSSSVDRSH